MATPAERDSLCRALGHALHVEFVPDNPDEPEHDQQQGTMVLRCWEGCWVDGKYELVIRDQEATGS